MKIRLNNTVWTVGFLDDEDKETWGWTITSKLKIQISKELTLPNARSTIVHEIVHALLFSYGFAKETHDINLLFSEEQVCDFIAMNIDNILRASDKVYCWYVSESEKRKKSV